jgi:hypothetical protein
MWITCGMGVVFVVIMLARAMFNDGRDSNDGIAALLGIVGIAAYLLLQTASDDMEKTEIEQMLRQQIAQEYTAHKVNPEDIEIINPDCVSGSDDCIERVADFRHQGELVTSATVTLQLVIAEEGYQANITVDGEPLQFSDETCVYVMPDQWSAATCMQQALLENSWNFESLTQIEGDCVEFNDSGYCTNASYSAGVQSRGARLFTGLVRYTANRITTISFEDQ